MSRSATTVADRVRRRVREFVPGVSRERAWLAVALGVGCLVYASYLFSHRYPAYGAGLYLTIAKEIAAHGYHLPTRIPGYTGDGVPFAYPPLMFYVAAVVRQVTGVAAIDYSLYAPGLVTVAYLVPYYYLARELLGSTRTAGVATVLLAVTPPTLQWHISAGGIVRAPAFLLTLCGCYVGVRLFRSGDRRWVMPGAILFGLTVLSHPVYTVFFGLSYLLLFARFDRTPRGFVHGALVAGGGLVLASPWLLWVLRTHGLDVITSAAGTHSGLGGGVRRLVSEVAVPVPVGPSAVFYLGLYAGGLLALAKRRWFLPAWVVASGFLIGKSRFLFVAGSMLTAVFLLRVVEPHLVRATRTRRRVASIAAAALVIVATLGTGVAFAVGTPGMHTGSPSQPSFIDAEDREAMAWIATATDPNADFVVLGDTAEWFPLFAHRTILVGPWGVEWTSPAQYHHQLALFRRVSTCSRAACLTGALSSANVDPEYVYVPKGSYTIRGFQYHQTGKLRASMVDSARYELIYENEGVLVFRVAGSGADSPPQTPPAATSRAEPTGHGSVESESRAPSFSASVSLPLRSSGSSGRSTTLPRPI